MNFADIKKWGLARLSAAQKSHAGVATVDSSGQVCGPSGAPVSGGGIRGRNIGTRSLYHKLGTIDSSSARTFQVTAELAAPFDAIRLVICNTSKTQAQYYVCKASVTSSAADLNNSAGAWSNVGQHGDITFTVPVAPRTNSSGARPNYGFSNWVPLASLDRTDGGIYPLVVVRAFDLLANAALPGYVVGTGDLTNWATKPDGRLWCARDQIVDGVTTPASFTSTTNQNRSPIIAIQYQARGRVVTVMSCGDSIASGQGTYVGQGFYGKAADAVRDALSIPIEYANFSWEGQNSFAVDGSGYMARAMDIMRGELCPDIMCMGASTPNDTAPTITQAIIDRTRWARERMTALAADKGVKLLLGNWMPSTNAVKAYGATDSLRVAENAMLAARYANVPAAQLIDVATPVNGSTHASGQIEISATYSTDGIHPNEAGNVLLAPIATTALTNLMGL